MSEEGFRDHQHIHCSSSFNRFECIIDGNLGIELNRHGGVFIQVTIYMLDIGNTAIAQGRIVSR